jgi:hypothetical protein
MALTLNIAALPSRIKDAEITLKREATGKLFSGALGAIKRIFNFGSFLFREISRRFNFKFQDLWGLIVQAYFAIKYFDPNQTDEQIQKTIEANNKTLVERGADYLGEFLGFQTVRLVNAAIGRIFKQGDKEVPGTIKIPVLSARVGLTLAEEGNENAKADLKAFLNAAAATQISNAFLSFLLTARKNQWFGLQSITSAQTNGSIAEKIDQQIEKLPEFWRGAVDNFIDGFEDGLIDAGYVVSTTIDDYYEAVRAANRDNGPIRTIEVKPSADSDEKFILKGNQGQVSQAAMTGLQTVFPAIQNRDVGAIAAMPINETIKLSPQLRQMTITYNEHSNAPFTRKGVVGTRAEISIPDVKAGISWKEVKATTRKFTRGNTFVQCAMDNGRQMSGYFVSESEGKQTIRELAKLSTADIDELSWRASTGEVSAGTHKKTQVMHPQKASLIYPRRNKKKNSGPLGKSVTLPIWQDAEPPGGFRADP